MNLRRVFHNKYIEFITVLFLFSGVLIVILTPDISIFKWTANFAIQTTILYIIAGLFFLLISAERLLLLSFFCAACLSLFLKGNFNPNLKLKIKSPERVLSIALVKFEENDPAELDLVSILENKPDVVCCNIGDSSVAVSFFKKLSNDFHYSVNFQGRTFDQIIYSKYPFVTVDTILIDENPQTLFSLKIPGYNENVYCINTLMLDPYNTNQSESYRYDLGRLIVYLRPITSPLAVVGNFNAVSWSGELNYFKKTLNLQDSRRAFYPSLPNPFEVPKDHIFFSKIFNCVDFHELRDLNGIHLGLFASFQLSDDKFNLNKPQSQ